MHLPSELQSAIDEIVQNSSSTTLRKAREILTKTYREGGDSSSIFRDEAQKLAYLGARMPATYSAVYKVLKKLSIPCEDLLDLGAGPGTASWAATDCFPDLKKITLLERSPEAISLGQKLSEFSKHRALVESLWIRQCLSQPFTIPKADLGILSYVLNELKDPMCFIEECWKSVSALVIIEPGTPRGFSIIKKIRDQLIHCGAFLIAPCPHEMACPIQGNDWCHFSVRVERTRLHRILKEGSLGYEDEKFCYLIAAKREGTPTQNRVIRHPLKHTGHSRLTLCTDKGVIEEKTISRKNKELYRKARDVEWGDSWSNETRSESKEVN